MVLGAFLSTPPSCEGGGLGCAFYFVYHKVNTMDLNPFNSGKVQETKLRKTEISKPNITKMGFGFAVCDLWNSCESFL